MTASTRRLSVGLERFDPGSVATGAAALTIWLPNADRMQALEALSGELARFGAESAGGRPPMTRDDWVGWLASENSEALRAVVANGVSDSPTVREIAASGGGAYVFEGTTPGAAMGAELLLEVLDEPDAEVLYGALVISTAMTWAAYSDKPVAWADHSLGQTIGVPDAETFADLCRAITVPDDVVASHAPAVETLSSGDGPLARLGGQLVVAQPTELIRAALRATPAADVTAGAVRRIGRACGDMGWTVEEQLADGVVARFDDDKLALVVTAAPAPDITRAIAGMRERFDVMRAGRYADLRFAIVAIPLFGEEVKADNEKACVREPDGPWLLELGDFQVLGDALRGDPLGLWRSLEKLAYIEVPADNDLMDALGAARRHDEDPYGRDEELPRDPTEYLHRRGRALALRHVVPGPRDPEHCVAVTRWAATNDTGIFRCEDRAEEPGFTILARAHGFLAWVRAVREPVDEDDLEGAIAAVTAFWLARLIESGLFGRPSPDVEGVVYVDVAFREESGPRLAVSRRPGQVRIVATQGFAFEMSETDNRADRALVGALVAALSAGPTGATITSIVDFAAPPGAGTLTVWPHPAFRRRRRGPADLDTVWPSELQRVEIEVSRALVEGDHYVVVQGSDAKDALDAGVKVALELLAREIAACQAELIVALVRASEQAVHAQYMAHAMLPSVAALAHLQQELGEYFPHGPDAQAPLSLRFLVELASARPPEGARRPSRELVVRLRALAECVIAWGTVSEAVHFGVATCTLSVAPAFLVLPEGPGLVSREAQVEIEGEMAPVRMARRNEAEFGPVSADLPELELDRPVAVDDPHWLQLNEAMAASWGCSFDALLRVGRALADVALAESTHLAVVDDPIERARSVTGLAHAECQAAIERLTLGPDPGYDFFASAYRPWHPNRARSHIQKPFVALPDGRLAIGGGNALRSLEFLYGLCISGRLRAEGPLRAAVEAVRSRNANAFVAAVARLCREAGWQTEEHVEQVAGTRIARSQSEELGDVDVLAWDPGAKRVLAIEAKQIHPSLTPRDLVRERKAIARYVDLHLARVEWLRANPGTLGAHIGAMIGTDWSIDGLLVSPNVLAGSLMGDEQPFRFAAYDQLDLFLR